MNNFKQPGNVMTCTAPYTRTAGQAALIGSLVGVAASDVASGAEGEFQFTGVFHSLAKATGAAWTVGLKLYWDASNKRFSTDSTVGQLAGVAAAAADSGDTTGTVRLNGVAPATAEGAQAAIADLTDNSGGATADGTIGAVTAPTALTDNGAGTADGTIEAMANPADTPASADALRDDLVANFILSVRNNFKEVTTTQTANRTAIIALTDAVKELATKFNTLLAELRAAGILAP